MLSPRQELILKLVVDAYLASGQPVPSKEIAERTEVEWGPSTVRAELAALEAAGYLTHPHTSAGRVPTESGYRHYVDLMMADRRARRAEVELELSQLRREIDEAMRETTAALAQVTDLMALVTAPPETVGGDDPPGRGAAPAAAPGDGDRDRLQRGRRQAGLRLRPAPVDPGLVEWASSYLNESLAGMGVGARMIADRLADPELGPVEAEFVATLGAAFTELEHESPATPSTPTARRACSPKPTSPTCPAPTS